MRKWIALCALLCLGLVLILIGGGALSRQRAAQPGEAIAHRPLAALAAGEPRIRLPLCQGELSSMIKNRAIVIPSVLMLALLLGCVSTAPPSLEPITPHAVAADAQPVVIDTDMAPDDWLAILYLLGRSDVDVQAITVTGAGEAHCSAGTRNAFDLVALAGQPEIPVACGREVSLEGDHAFPTEWRERVDDLLGLTLPENSREVSSESAVELLTRIIQGSPQKVHLIVLGPLTNVGEVLEAEPALVMNLEMITVMGGR
jgi:hypothetical protein